ncbi:polysaccharide deacetylase family protein [Nonomuraea sp. NPDC005650]|uniref:polysaccharide deacetylase family protein n=1 Tax=Nonomuraea sp. NPDC005650 TaxID=3157045 RepID=UPI00339E1B74
MDIGTRPRLPFLGGARRGTAGTVATAALVAMTCGASTLVAPSHAAHAAPPAGAALDTASSAVSGAVSGAASGAALSTASGAALDTAAAGALGAAAFAAPGDTGGATRARPRVDCRHVKCVALTFDDGPGPYTDTLLAYLAAYRARATFFVVGSNVVTYPRVLRRTVAAGHEIGNHTWSHPDLRRLSPARVRSQLVRTDQAIQAATGVVPRLVRPPYGAFNRTVRRQTARPLVLWSVDTVDWRYRNSATVARRALRWVRPGSVILFHDIHPTTVRAIPRVLRTLAKRGYRFVTVSELFGGHPPRVVFSAAPPELP